MYLLVGKALIIQAPTNTAVEVRQANAAMAITATPALASLNGGAEIKCPGHPTSTASLSHSIPIPRDEIGDPPVPAGFRVSFFSK